MDRIFYVPRLDRGIGESSITRLAPRARALVDVDRPIPFWYGEAAARHRGIFPSRPPAKPGHKWFKGPGGDPTRDGVPRDLDCRADDDVRDPFEETVSATHPTGTTYPRSAEPRRSRARPLTRSPQRLGLRRTCQGGD